jgi:hypothetical protein
MVSLIHTLVDFFGIIIVGGIAIVLLFFATGVLMVCLDELRIYLYGKISK